MWAKLLRHHISLITMLLYTRKDNYLADKYAISVESPFFPFIKSNLPQGLNTAQSVVYRVRTEVCINFILRSTYFNSTKSWGYSKILKINFSNFFQNLFYLVTVAVTIALTIKMMAIMEPIIFLWVPVLSSSFEDFLKWLNLSNLGYIKSLIMNW